MYQPPNKLEPAARALVDKGRAGVRNVSNAVDSAVGAVQAGARRLSDGAQDNNPDLRKIAPATGAPRNRPSAMRPDPLPPVQVTARRKNTTPPKPLDTTTRVRSNLNPADRGRSSSSQKPPSVLRAEGQQPRGSVQVSMPDFSAMGAAFSDAVRDASGDLVERGQNFLSPADRNGRTGPAPRGGFLGAVSDAVRDASGNLVERGQNFLSPGASAPQNKPTPITRNFIAGDRNTVFANPNDPNGTALAEGVNTFDMASSNAQYARANEIRQQTVDAQPRGAGIVVPEQASGGSAMFDRALRLREQAGRTRDPGKAAALFSQARQLTDGAERADEPRGDSALQRTLMELQAQQPLNDARAFQAEAAGIAALRDPAAENRLQLDDLPALVESGAINFVDGEIDLSSEIGRQVQALLMQSGGGQSGGMAEGGVVSAVRSFAEGGFVAPIQTFADGGAVTPGTGAIGPDALVRYQEYARGSTAMGLPPVPLDQFLQMQMGAAPRADQAPVQAPPAAGAIQMAQGGQVPDVSGKMVVDTDPNAPTDSIPAVIDGQQPAALDSGEFVFPTQAVMFYGLDRLNKMIAKAKESSNGGQEQRPAADASAGPSAIGSALGG